MKDAEDFKKIEVAMNIIQYKGEKQVEYKNKFLVMKKASEYRKKRDRYKDNPWEVPGGKIEISKLEYAEEDIKREALRELKEETNIEIDWEKFLEDSEIFKPYSTVQESVEIIFYPVYLEFDGDPVEVDAVSEEHEKLEWINREKFMDRMTENEKEALRKI